MINIGQLLEWEKPDPETTYNTVLIYRSTSQTGTYTQIASQSVTDQTYFDINGTSTSWYKIRFYDSTNNVYSDYSEALQAGDSVGYVIVEDVKDMLKIDDAEWDDDQVQKWINTATKMVDDATGRTWQGAQTVTNEYYDGEDNEFVYLKNTDIQSLTAIAVRKEGESSFTTVTPSYVHLYTEGRIQLDDEAYPGAEVSIFPKGFKNVRVSYTYGNNYPTEDVRLLTLLYIAQMIQPDDEREPIIGNLVDKLKFNAPSFV